MIKKIFNETIVNFIFILRTENTINKVKQNLKLKPKQQNYILLYPENQ